MRTFAPPDKNPPVYLKTQLLNHHTGQPQVVHALVDSGNTVATSAAISSRLATQLGIQFQPLSLTCGTAAEGQTVEVKGLARNIRLALSPTTVVAMGRVLVIEGLSGGLNLGAKFLMELGAGIQFHPDGTAHLTVQGESIPLTKKVQGQCLNKSNKVKTETRVNAVLSQASESRLKVGDPIILPTSERREAKVRPSPPCSILANSPMTSPHGPHLSTPQLVTSLPNTPEYSSVRSPNTERKREGEVHRTEMERGEHRTTPPHSLSMKADDSYGNESENPEVENLQVGATLRSDLEFSSSHSDPEIIHSDGTSLGRSEFKISEFSLLNQALNDEFVAKSSSHIIFNANHVIKTQIAHNVNVNVKDEEIVNVNLKESMSNFEGSNVFVNELYPPKFPFRIRRSLKTRYVRSTQDRQVGRDYAGRAKLGVRIGSLSPFDAGKQVNHRLELVHSVIVPAMSVSIGRTHPNLHSRRKSFFLEEQRVGELRIAQGIVSEGQDGSVAIIMVNETEDPIQVPAGSRWPCQPLTSSTHLVDTDTLLQEPGLAPFPAQDLPDLPDVNPPGHSSVHSSSGYPVVDPPSTPVPQSSPGIAELEPGDLDDLASQVETDPEFRRIWDELKLGQNTLLAQNPNILKQVRRLVHEYQDIFSTSAPGETDLVELSLKLKEGTEPIRQKGRPMNPAMEANLQSQVEDWLAQGVIEPSDSPWCSPLVPVKKKDGSVRWAVDFRRVNACLEQDSYPLPRIQQLLEKAGGHQVYSALDATQAYFNIRIDPASRKVTAFATPNGLYQFRRMPFGLSVSPAVYSRFIAVALNKLGTKEINSYLDDVLVFNNGLNKHADRLRDVFQAHREAGVKLKPSKTLLFREKVEYLGHMLSKDGISMVDAYVDRIMEWPVPTNIKELNTLLGFFSYYRAFIPGFAELTAAMCSQRREKTLNWTPEMTVNLDKLKAEFQTHPIRAAPRFDSEEPFQLTTDYSSIAIGAVLSQVQDGQERLIAADGRKTTGPEKRYPSWKGELSAIVRGIRKFAPILSFKPFIINTDSKALVQLKSLKQCTGMLARWTEELAGYDFTVKHRPGKDNLNADALSRSEHMPDPTQEEEEEHDSYIGSITNPQPSVYPQDLARSNLLRGQATDPLLREVREWVVKGQPPDKLLTRGMSRAGQQYARNFDSLTLAQDGVLIMKVETIFGPRTRVLVPDSLKESVFKMSHDHRSAGHFGVTATIARMRRDWWYPDLASEVTNRVGVCHQCLAKIVKEKVKAGIHIPQKNGYPLQSLYIDLVGPLPQSGQGNRYILSVEDGFSRFIQLFPLPSKHAAGVAKVLVNEVIKTFGCPMRIHSDNGQEFCAKIMEEVYSRLDILHTRTPAYNPCSNPVERFHRTLNQMLRVITARDDKEWEDHLAAITLAYNTKVNVATGVTPSLAFLGREAKLPVDMILQTPEVTFPTPHHCVQDFISRYQTVYQYTQRVQEGVIRRNAKLYSGLARFRPGDLVWYFSTRSPAPVKGEQSKPAKHLNRWIGPWVVEAKVSEVLYKIKPWDSQSRLKPMTTNVSKLREMRSPPNQVTIPADWEPGEDPADPLEEVGLGEPHSPGTGMDIPVYHPQDFPTTLDRADPEVQGQRPNLDPDPLEAPLSPLPLSGGSLPTQVENDPGYILDPGDKDMEEVPPVPGPSNRPDPVRHARSRSVKREREKGEGEGSPPPRRKSQPRQTENDSALFPSNPESPTALNSAALNPSALNSSALNPTAAVNSSARLDLPVAVNDQRRGRSANLNQVMRGVGERVKGWAETAVTLTQDSDEEMAHLSQIFAPLSLGVKTPNQVNSNGTFICYAPTRITLHPGRVNQVDTKLYGTLPQGKVCTLYTPTLLARQAISIYPNFITTSGKLSVLIHNNNHKEVIVQHGQNLCKGSWLSYSD